MSRTKIALAIPLVLGIACSTTGEHARSDTTGAMWTDGAMKGDAERQQQDGAAQAAAAGGSQDGLAVQPASGSSADGSTWAAADSSGSSDSAGSTGSSSPSDQSGGDRPKDGIGQMGTGGATEGAPGSTSDSAPGGSMGSGGSSETMGSSTTGQDRGPGASEHADHAQAGSNTGAHEGDQLVHGKLSKVSKDQISISAKRGEAKTLKISPDTVVTINGKDAKPTQLKKGQMVRASYENVNGDDVAVKIEVGKLRHGRHMKGHMGGSAGHMGGASGGASEGGGSSAGGGSDSGASGGSR